MDGDGNGDHGSERHAAPEGHPDCHAFGKGVNRHHDDHEEHLLGSLAARGLEHQLLFVLLAQEPLGDQDEDHSE